MTTMLHTPPVSVPDAVIAPGQPTGPDAEILRLGVILDHFIGREQQAWELVSDDAEDDDPASLRARAACGDTLVVVKQITGLQAHLLDGLRTATAR